jgi:hypothetical protein
MFLRHTDHTGNGWTEQVSKNDEVAPPCRRVTLLRHAIKYGTGMLTKEENMDYSVIQTV